MSENSACPDRNTLKELLLGKLPKPELESLGKHLLQCEHCTKSADTIVAEDDLTTAMHARRILKGDEEVLTKVLERGKRLISQAETVIPDSAGTAEDNIDANATKIGMLGDHSDDEFGFLAPAQESDEIGRLGDYRILQVLGIGGMGVVFRAEDTRLKQLDQKVPVT